MNDNRRVTISKYLSKHLRHSPAEIGLTLEPGGWVPIAVVLTAAARHRFQISREELDEVVAKCDKRRFALDATGLKIRANQGHSTDVDMQFTRKSPPETLFHGTGSQSREAIQRDGLRRISRQHVHLSADTDTARRVGARHGKPVVFVIEAARMHGDGFAFYQADNGVWLTDHVPPGYLRLPDEVPRTPPPDSPTPIEWD
jgi:putative RNA 2'-phosphotransferase